MTVVKENQSHETVDDNNGEESVERPASGSQEQQQESETDTDDDDEASKIKQFRGKTRRDSGWYPPNWNLLLNPNEPRPPTLAGITEVCINMHMHVMMLIP